jgi:hypothetical protein
VILHLCDTLPEGAIKTFDHVAGARQPTTPCPWIAVLIRSGLNEEGPTNEIGQSWIGDTPITAACYHAAPWAIERWRGYQRASGRMKD